MVVLSSHVAITTDRGTIVPHIAEISATSSVSQISDTATITLPRRQIVGNKLLHEVVKRGDAITIQIGYNAQNTTILQGYILSADGSMPCKIECEAESYLLKQVKLEPKAHTHIKLKKLLAPLMPTGINVSVPDMDIVNLHIKKNTPLLKLITGIADDYSIRFFISGKTLYGVLPTALVTPDATTHKIDLRKNTVADNLVYTSEEDIKVGIIAKTMTKDNKVLEVQVGDKDGEVRTYWNNAATSTAELKKFAEQKMAEFRADKVTGTVTLWGLPFVKKADILHITDAERETINGKKFFVETVHYVWGNGGYRQTITIGNKV
ncbi:MAG: hypothetical protein SNJ71_00155 [Bacteroidales bacterium]